MNEVEQINIEIDAAKELVAKGDALERLHSNPDFKLIILDGFFKEHAITQVELKAHPAMQGEDQQRNILKAIDSIGELRGFFGAIYAQAESAAEGIRAAEGELEAMAEEGEL